MASKVKAKQTKKAKRKATMALPSSTKGGGEKGSVSRKTTTASRTMVTRGSVTGPKKETLSTPVRSNKKNKKKKLNVVSLEKKTAVKTMMEVSKDIFISARDARDAIEKEKDEEVTKNLMNSSLGLAEKQTRSEKKQEQKVNKETEIMIDKEVDEEANEPVTVNNKCLEDAGFLKENPQVKKLLLTIEDMMVDYRTSNVHSMNADNQTFHEVTDKMVNNYFTTSKTEKMYKRYQQMWISYATKKQINKRTTKDALDQHLLTFFIELGNHYAPSSLYVIYSCINHHFITANGFKLNSMLRLQRYLKLNTSTYVCKKSKVFSSEQIDILLKYCSISKNPAETLMGVGVSLMYYGLLRVCDARKVQMKDVSHDKSGRVIIKFDHTRKKKNEGFTYHIPSLYQGLFSRYESELDPDLSGEEMYLRLFQKGLGVRKNPVGPKTVSDFVKTACAILKVNPKGYTSHCFRCSAATNLADAGVSFINLKRHGQWKSDSVAEAYIANSKVLRDEREMCLLPENVRHAYLQKKAISFSQLTQAPFLLPTQPDSTQGTTLGGNHNDDDSFSLEDEPIVNLLKKKPASKKKKTHPTPEPAAKNGQNNDTQLFDKEDEVVFVKTTPASEKTELEVVNDEDDFVQVERVVSKAQLPAVPVPDFAPSSCGTSFSSLFSQAFLGAASTGEAGSNFFANCVFNFKS